MEDLYVTEEGSVLGYFCTSIGSESSRLCNSISAVWSSTYFPTDSEIDWRDDSLYGNWLYRHYRACETLNETSAGKPCWLSEPENLSELMKLEKFCLSATHMSSLLNDLPTAHEPNSAYKWYFIRFWDESTFFSIYSTFPHPLSPFCSVNVLQWFFSSFII